MTVLDNGQIALLVHDLKNPLAALLSNLGYVATTVEGDVMTAEAVDDCLLSTEVLGRLIENISVIGLLEGRPPAPAMATPAEVLSTVETNMRRHAETSGLGLEVRLEPDLEWISGSPKLLALSLTNLVATSLTHAPASSTVTLAARRRGQGALALSVVDDGPPVSAEMREQVGRKEAQVMTKSAKGGRYGRAFGIYVADLVARSYGGTLEVAEEEGRCVFSLLMPVARP